MTAFHAIILGIIQGITEFFPISSSAHLILLRPVLGFGEPDLWFDVFLHGGTLLAVFIFLIPHYWRLFRKPLEMVWVLVATIPAAIFGILFESKVELAVRSNVPLICSLLLVVGVIFLFVRDRGWKKLEDIRMREALLIGLAQALALLPGVSRSGITLLMALLLGIRREDAVLFSFFLSLTTLGGAFAKGIMELHSAGGVSLRVLAPGFIAAFICGMIACFFLLRVVQKKGLAPFGYYRIVFGVAMILFFLIRG
ncbi:MAG: undecaprenyl-diphosphate phosphatase, partial [Atribacterota bacterium]